MSEQGWSWYAIRESDGAKVSPIDAANRRDDRYTITGIEVIPVVGEVNRPHWRSISGVGYTRPDGMQPREMSPWHKIKIAEAIECGMEDEYRIENGELIADAYDPTTNTVYEYVWAHDDHSKVHRYFELGYNQVWVYSKEKNWGQRVAYLRVMNVAKRVEKLGGVSAALYTGLPTIEVKYE